MGVGAVTDDQLRDIYLKATGLDLNAVGENKRGYEQGHAFIKALFDALPIADTTPDFEPLYRRPD